LIERAITFGCGADELIGVLHIPALSFRSVGVLIAVGGPQYRVGSHRQFVIMARAFASAGYPVMRFDYRGMGDSEGEFKGFAEVDEDLRYAMSIFLREVAGLHRIVIFGLCDGASAAMIFAATGGPGLAGLMLANPWVHSEPGQAKTYVRHYYRGRVIQLDFWRKVLRGQFRWGASVRDFVRKLRLSLRRPAEEPGGFVEKMLEGLNRFAGPVMLLLSERDLTAKEFQELCESSEDWRRSIGHPRIDKTFIAGADHTFSSRSSLDDACHRCITWLGAVDR
jgi:exosortase A-associated hydrolase 1